MIRQLTSLPVILHILRNMGHTAEWLSFPESTEHPISLNVLGGNINILRAAHNSTQVGVKALNSLRVFQNFYKTIASKFCNALLGNFNTHLHVQGPTTYLIMSFMRVILWLRISFPKYS